MGNNFGFNPYLPYGGQQFAAAPQPGPGRFICRPVASREEAMAVQTDFNGGVIIMPDVTNGCIYVKRLDVNSGTSVFSLYRQAQDPPQQGGGFATREELASLRSELTALSERIGGTQNVPNE